MSFADIDWTVTGPALWLTLKLAVPATAILIVLGLPVSWWLATLRANALRAAILAFFSLPLVLPPAGLGFYLLIFAGKATGSDPSIISLGYSGLLLAACIAALPFAVLPMTAGFLHLPRGLLGAAQTLGASRSDAFRTIALPLARPGILVATVLTLTTTLGASGLMVSVGRDIPGSTRVFSTDLLNQIDAGNLAAAHALSAMLLGVAFLGLTILCALALRRSRAHG